MGGQEFQKLSWSVRVEEASAACDRAIDALVRTCTQACARSFPEEDGFSISQHRLSGALEGITLKVTSASFSGFVSLQQFTRPSGAHDEALRLVASARFEAAPPPAPKNRSRIHWGVAGCSFGGLGVGAVFLQLTGLVTTWSQVVYLLPVLMIGRLCMAIKIAADLQRDALALAEQSSIRALSEAEDSPLRQAERRWDNLLRFLASQRDTLASELHRRPFRSAADAAESVDNLQALPLARPAMAAVG